jgi:hypothetical protein
MSKFEIKKRRLRHFDATEIHEYTLDLQRITLLRDKCEPGAERENYDRLIHVMQEVLIYLHTLDEK